MVKPRYFYILETTIFLIGLLFIYKSAIHPHLHPWDERYHALVAKNCIDDPLKPTLYKTPILGYDYKQWTLNHVWLHKQPMSLWLNAIAIKMFGNHVYAVRLWSILFFILSGFLLYHISRFFIKEDAFALLPSFFFYVNGFLLEVFSGSTSTDHVDAHFVFYFLLALYALIRYIESQKNMWLIFFGIVLGVSWLTKTYTSAVLILLLFILDDSNLKSRFGKMALAGLIAMIIYAPWQLYIHGQFPLEASWEAKQALLHFTTIIENHSGAWWYHLEQMHRIWHELIYAGLFLFGYMMVQSKFERKYIALSVWLILPYIVFSIAATKMRGYVAISGPACFIIEALCIQWIMKARWPVYIKNILLGISLVLPLAYGIDRAFKKHDATAYSEYSIQILNLISHRISKEKTNLIFGTEHYVEYMFHFDNLVAYHFIPDQKLLDSLSHKYHVIVFDDLKH